MLKSALLRRTRFNFDSPTSAARQNKVHPISKLYCHCISWLEFSISIHVCLKNSLIFKITTKIVRKYKNAVEKAERQAILTILTITFFIFSLRLQNQFEGCAAGLRSMGTSLLTQFFGVQRKVEG